ncbi:hypothetical protein [Streptomyces sp. NK15101]|uniref:hypothetical protein n=1 Tax=Streptomyces sp. NK15101 TaxID=2873261 RepID=UPI001CED5A6E|nr:hypothetical protein [Streptomyces sp. NK15101]
MRASTVWMRSIPLCACACACAYRRGSRSTKTPDAWMPVAAFHEEASVVVPRPAGLISILLDGTARIDERDDAAMDLEAYSGEHVVQALVDVAGSPVEDELVLASAAESLGRIPARDGGCPEDLLLSLRPDAKRIAEEVLRASRQVE